MVDEWKCVPVGEVIPGQLHQYQITLTNGDKSAACAVDCAPEGSAPLLEAAVRFLGVARATPLK